ncbi:hypothetical protein AX16_002292 [Volvariella volvacea WC 439]|nr:hypothetical protein AX16_002292 [Volvariella volvacea WC 439]
MPTETIPHDPIEAICSALSEAPPYCTGISELTELGGHFYFRTANDEPGFINFANATEAQLKSLVEACAPATFGMNDKDVYDETYRRARQMDTSFFSTKFDPVFNGIVKAIEEQLRHSLEDVRAELYKLNIYGEERVIFQSSQRTPRQETMFGSLVVVFPTAHEGGNLLLRRGGQQWTFSAKKLLASTTKPSIAFVAFYSDIEHEVEVVSSGYRVTLTYNLYHGHNKRPANVPTTTMIDKRAPDEGRIRSAISSFLEEKRTEVLPNGGYLGFGLLYNYPLRRPSGKRVSLKTLPLKGSDKILWRVLESLHLKPSIRMLIEGEEFDVLVPNVPDARWFSGVDTTWEYYFDDGVVIHKAENGHLGHTSLWIDEPYAAFGNGAQLDYFYAEACMIAQVDPLSGGVLESEREVKGGSSEEGMDEEEETEEDNDEDEKMEEA